MSIDYKIHPELNIVFLYCKDHFTADEYFQTIQAIFQDNLYHHGMMMITDCLKATVEFTREQMHDAIEYTEAMVERGLEQDHIVLLTLDAGLHNLVQAMKLISHKVSLKLDAYYSLDGATSALGLSELRQEIRDCHEAVVRDSKTKSARNKL